VNTVDRSIIPSMRRRVLMTLALLTLLAVAPDAPAAGFSDPFVTLDQQRWTVGDHPLGLGRFDPANVSVADGALALTLPAGSLNGGEVRTTSTWGAGTFRARIKAAATPSSLTGFFLYSPPDYESEVDIEIVRDTVLLSTYARGTQTHTETRALGFDPTAAFHDYEIELTRHAVTFRVDGRALRTWKTGVPKAPMALYLNAWFPTWLAGQSGTATAATLVDQVSIVSNACGSC
jgi:beta-glucanase (GH16 family)